MQTHTTLHVNEWNPHAERLRHRVHGILDARVTVRVVGEHQPGKRRGFLMLRRWREVIGERRPQDTRVNRLEAAIHAGDSTRGDR